MSKLIINDKRLIGRENGLNLRIDEKSLNNSKNGFGNYKTPSGYTKI